MLNTYDNLTLNSHMIILLLILIHDYIRCYLYHTGKCIYVDLVVFTRIADTS